MQQISSAGVWLRGVYNAHWGNLSAKERILKIVKIAAVLAVLGGLIALFVANPLLALTVTVLAGFTIQGLSCIYDLYKAYRTRQFQSVMDQAALAH